MNKVAHFSFEIFDIFFFNFEISFNSKFKSRLVNAKSISIYLVFNEIYFDHFYLLKTIFMKIN